MYSRGAFTLAFAFMLTGFTAAPAADAKLKFELYKDNAGEFRWRLKDGDTTLATSGQGYKAKADAKKGIERIQKDAAGDEVTFESYEDNKKEHRWRLKVKNGNVIASSASGYSAKKDAEAAIKKVKDGAKDAEVSDDTK